jgi:hypothetical protein
MYIGYLALGINSCSEDVILFADTCVTVCSKNSADFCPASVSVLSVMSKWYTANCLVIGLDKTQMIKFLNINAPHSEFGIDHK